MKTIKISFILSLFFLSCNSQNFIIEDLSNEAEMNYVFANVLKDSIIKRELWNGGQFITIFTIFDSKATPENYFEGTDEVLSSLLISAVPDGDYYTNSKLYKVKGLYNPKIIEVAQMDFPKFSVKIEHGSYNKRKIEVFEFNGIE